MSQDSSNKISNKRYVFAAVAAMFFLLVLPGFVLAMASNMTGIDIITIGAEMPLAPHEVLERKRIGPAVAIWIRTDENTSADEMKRIVRRVVTYRYRGEPKMTVYFFRTPDPESNMPKQPAIHESDDTYIWTPSGGIRKIL